MAFVSRNLRAVTVHSMRRNAKSCSGNNKSGKIGVFRRHLASYPVGSKDERHSEAFLDIENTKPYVKNHEIHVTERCEELFKDILKLDTVEMHLLTQLVKVRFGLSPNDATDVGFGRNRAATGGDADKEEMANEERTIFDLKLTGFDDKSKIKVIKEVRSISGLGLKDAKELVEGVPKVVKKDVKKDEADELKLKLEAVGATVEIV